jgi:hypothetical protein
VEGMRRIKSNARFADHERIVREANIGGRILHDKRVIGENCVTAK